MAATLDIIETRIDTVRKSENGFRLHLIIIISAKSKNKGISTVITSQVPELILQIMNSDNWIHVAIP